MSFKYFQRRECPICNGTRNDCRQSISTGIVHCRDGSANPIGWHLIREDAQGFLMWGEGDGKDAISREERERRQQEQRLIRQRRDEEKRRGALPSGERDAAIRTLHKHFGLSSAHRADLQRRGLTDTQIEKLLYFTIQPGERMPMGIPENFPGVANGRLCGKEGYACHAFSPEGHAIGSQIRLDNPEGGKYRWNKGAVSSHLSSGELPITYVRPVDGQIKRKAIGICEGISKPAIAAQKLGQIFIGASGFMFSKLGEGESPKPSERVPLEQLVQYLEAASAELGTKDVEIFPDAGVVRNAQLFPKYQWLLDALTQLGYKVKIAWWGQIDKPDKDKPGSPDCDELVENQQIRLIAPGSFLDLAKKFGGADSAWMQRVRRDWKKKRTFTPDITSCTKYVNWARPSDNTIFFGRAGLGSGKTTQLRKWAEESRAEDPDTRFFLLGYRNTLLMQTVADMSSQIEGLQHIHEAEGILRGDSNTSFALCVDSLLKFVPEDFDSSILYLDEIASIIRHLLHSLTIPWHKRDKILKLFEEAIRRARTLVCMDGLLADWAVDYIAAICPEKKIIRAQNTYKEDKPTISFLLGTQDFDKNIKVNDRSPWVKLMLEEAPLPVIVSDSQVFLEGMDEIFQERGVKTLRIDAKTIPEDYAKAFLADCNQYIQDQKIDVLLYSPSAESGLDISIEGWFTHQFCFFFGVLGVDAIIQMIGRIRDPKVKRFLWCKEWVAVSEREHTKSPCVLEVEKSCGWIVQEEVAESAKSEGVGGSSEELKKRILAKISETLARSLDVHFKTSCLLKSIEHAEKTNLRSFLREALLTEGYKVNDWILSPFDEYKELEKEAKEDVKRQNCADIFHAPVKEEEIEELANSRSQFDARWEDRCRRMKAGYLDRLPGIREFGVWNEDFIYLAKYEDPNFLAHQELFWLLEHPQEAEKEGIRRLHYLARCEKTFIGNIKSRFLKIKAYLNLEIRRFFNLDATWSNDSPEIQELLEKCKAPAIAKIFGHPGKMQGVQNLTRLLKPLGIFLKSFRPHEGARKYKIDSEQFFNPARGAVLKAIALRYEKAKLKELPLDWNQIFEPAGEAEKRSTPPLNILINTGEGGAAETIDNTGVSADFDKNPAPGLEPSEKSDGVSQKNKSTEIWVGNLLVIIPQRKSDKELEISENTEKSGSFDDFFLEAAETTHCGDTTLTEDKRGNSLQVPANEDVVPTPLEILVESLEKCQTSEEFRLAILGLNPQFVEDAIVCQDSSQKRSLLRRWFEAIGVQQKSGNSQCYQLQ